MSYKIIAIPKFKKEVKQLSKKYPSFKNDFAEFLLALETDPFSGVLLTNNCYKYRIAIKSKNKGKSSGARIIAHIVITDSSIYLLSIFDKSTKETISDKDINDLLELIEN